MPLDVQFHMRLSTEQLERIRRVAEDRDFKLSTWVRSAVMEKVKRLERAKGRKSHPGTSYDSPPEIRRVAEPGTRPPKHRP